LADGAKSKPLDKFKERRRSRVWRGIRGGWRSVPARRLETFLSECGWRMNKIVAAGNGAGVRQSDIREIDLFEGTGVRLAGRFLPFVRFS
jgi:hypothetical protein